MTTEENKAIVRHWIDEVWCKKNIAAVDEFMAGNFVFDWAPPGVPSDIHGYKKAVTILLTAFLDLQITVDDIIAEGDKVAVRWVGDATHEGEFLGIEPTGKKVVITGVSFVHIVDGKILEEWSEMDLLGVIQQLGMYLTTDYENTTMF